MWISRAEMRRLLDQLAQERKRASTAEERLADEIDANRRSDRHWAQMFLRSKAIGSQPLPAGKPERPDNPPVTATPVAEIDPGELEALVEAGKNYGVERADVERMLRKERGLD